MPSDASLSRFGVFPDMIPRWYAPILNQPTSSPMMTRMFGGRCCCCADAGVSSAEATNAAKESQTVLLLCMPLSCCCNLRCGRPVGRPLERARQAVLIARGAGGRLLDLLHDAAEVVALRRLQRRELLERLQVFQPQLLANGQEVPVVLERGCRGTERTARCKRRLHARANGLLKGIAFDVLHQREVERDQWQNPAIRPGLRHVVVHLPVLVAHRGRRGS